MLASYNCSGEGVVAGDILVDMFAPRSMQAQHPHAEVRHHVRTLNSSCRDDVDGLEWSGHHAGEAHSWCTAALLVQDRGAMRANRDTSRKQAVVNYSIWLCLGEYEEISKTVRNMSRQRRQGSLSMGSNGSLIAADQGAHARACSEHYKM